MLKCFVKVGCLLALSQSEGPVRLTPGTLSPASAFSPALFPSTQLSLLFLFNHLRTLSFSVTHLSRIHPTASALFQKKRGAGVPLVQPIQLVTGFTASLLPRESYRGDAKTSPVSSFTTSLLPRELLRGVAKTSLLSSFTASLLPRELLRGVAKTGG